jgi:hypothetical protein
VFELRDVKTTGGKFITLINLDQVTDGIYFIVFANGQNKVVKKFFVKM